MGMEQSSSFTQDMQVQHQHPGDPLTLYIQLEMFVIT